jgi:hypothetical protein
MVQRRVPGLRERGDVGAYPPARSWPSAALPVRNEAASARAVDRWAASAETELDEAAHAAPKIGGGCPGGGKSEPWFAFG